MRIARLNWIIIFRALADYKITCALPAFVGLLILGDYMLLPVKPRLYDGKKIKQKIIIAVVHSKKTLFGSKKFSFAANKKLI